MFVEEKTQGEPQPVKVGTLKLSEAIRIGARYRPQGFGGVCNQLIAGKSCALLAAYEAVEGYPESDSSFDSSSLSSWAERLFGFDARSFAMCHNDSLRWSRESIAAALESRGF